jgi:pre-mRNA-splicing factor SYF1
MPRIWLDYCQFLMDQCKITRNRRVFDRAIRALPITQHNRIWPLYIEFVSTYPDIPDTAMRVFRRYLKVSPKRESSFIVRSVHSVTTRMCRRIHRLSQRNRLSRRMCQTVRRYFKSREFLFQTGKIDSSGKQHMASKRCLMPSI